MRRAPFGIVVDAAVFGMSPYGGLIQHWEHLLRGFGALDVPVELVGPQRSRAPLPELASTQWIDYRKSIFHSSYFSLPDRPIDATAVTVHDVIYEEFPDAARTLDPSNDALRQKRSCVAEADLVIVPSETTLRGFRQHYPRCDAEVSVIAEGVDETFSTPVARGALVTAARLRAAQDCSRPYLIHVGGREQYKNFSFLLDTYLGTSLHRDFDLVVVGSQPAPLDCERGTLEGADKAARVAFLGKVPLPVLAALYRDAAVHVAPSVAEGFGLSPLEAAASGTPVAHSAIAIFEETMGNDAFPFSPADPSDCERAIRAAASCEVARLAALRGRIRGRFNWRHAVQETIAAYGRVLALA